MTSSSKAGSDLLRDEQRKFLNQLKAAGGLPFIARSFKEFRMSFKYRRLYFEIAVVFS